MIYARILAVLIPVIIAVFLYVENHSLQKDKAELLATVSIQKDNLNVLSLNLDKAKNANKTMQETIDKLTESNNRASEVIETLSKRKIRTGEWINSSISLIETKTLKDGPAAEVLVKTIQIIQKDHENNN